MGSTKKDLESKNLHLRNIVPTLRSNNTRLRKQIENSKEVISTLRDANTRLKKQVENSKEVISTLRNANTRLKKQVEESKKTVPTLRNNNERLKKETEHSKKTILDLHQSNLEGQRKSVEILFYLQSEYEKESDYRGIFHEKVLNQKEISQLTEEEKKKLGQLALLQHIVPQLPNTSNTKESFDFVLKGSNTRKVNNKKLTKRTNTIRTKFKKLYNNPHAFFRDSNFFLLRILQHFFK